MVAMNLQGVEKFVNRSQPRDNLITVLAVYSHENDDQLYLHVYRYPIDPQTMEWDEKESAQSFVMPMSNFSQNLSTTDDLERLVDVLDDLVAG
jgi:hypothetical protein